MSENVTGLFSSLAYGAATGLSLPAFALDSYTPILDLENLTLPSASRQVDEYPVLDQATVKRLVGGITYSECTFTIVRAFDSAAHDTLEDNVAAALAVRRNWRGSLPNAGNQINYWVGYASKFEFQGITNQTRIQIACAITVDGYVQIVR